VKRIAVYFFSGTGVTDLVTQAIVENLRGRGCSVEAYSIPEILAGTAQFPSVNPDMVGFGCPVIGFGTPRIVKLFLERLPRESGAPAFIFRTAGGAAPINFRASAPMVRKLGRRGYSVFHERIFAIASNWHRPHDPPVVYRLLQATRAKVERFCAELVLELPRRPVLSFRTRLALDLLRGLGTFSLRWISLDLSVSPACSHCGLCERGCPMRNIKASKGRVRIGTDCTQCLRCVYACPSKAISFKHLKALPIPGGFSLRRTLEEAELRKSEQPERVPPFLQRYESELGA
jgi:ferredoxin